MAGPKVPGAQALIPARRYVTNSQTAVGRAAVGRQRGRRMPGRLAPQARRSAVAGLASSRPCHDFPGLNLLPGGMKMADAERCGDDTWPVS
jgi:hypothetical protein